MNQSSGPTIAEQIQMSLKLKEHQQALIDSRRLSQQSPLSGSQKNSVSPNQVQSNNSGIKLSSLITAQNNNSMDHSGQLKILTEGPLSPKSMQYMRPMMTPNFREPATPNRMRSSSNSPPLTASQKHTRFLAARHQFTQFFETLYDSNDNLEQLSSILKEQIQQSNVLINALRSSGNTIETLVAKHFKDMQTKMTERFALALTDLNRRIKVLEDRSRGGSPRNTFSNPGSSNSPKPTFPPNNGKVSNIDQLVANENSQ